MLDDLSDAVLETDAHDRITHLNAAAASLLGCVPADVVGVRAEVALVSFPDLVACFAEAGSQRVQRTIPAPSSRTTAEAPASWQVSIHPVVQEGRLRGRLAILREHVTESRYRMLAEHANDLICLHEPDGRYAYVSPTVRSLLGYDPDELIGRSPYDFIHPKDGVRIQATAHKEVLEGRVVQQTTLRLRTKAGAYVWVETYTRPVFGDDGDVIQLVTSSRDITDRVRAEQALRESEERFRLLAEYTSDLVCLHDPDGRYLYVSPSVRDLLGFTPEELVGQDPYALFHPDDRDRIRHQSHLPLLNGWGERQVEYRIRHRSGAYKWFETYGKPIRTPEGEVVQLVTASRDVTERKQAEEDLRRAYRLLRQHVDNSPLGVIEWDRAFRVLRWSRQAEAILGWSESEAIGKHFNELSIVHPDDQDLVMQSTQELHGTVRRNIVSNRNVTRDGRTIHGRWYNSVITGEHDGDLTILSLLEDVTDRVQARERLERSLHEKEVLLHEVHHRVKNNLQLVSSMLDLQGYYLHDPQIKEAVRETQNRVRSMGLIHERLLHAQEMARVNFAEYAGKLVDHLEVSYAVGDRVDVVLRLEPILIDVDTAVSCGLILNELVSNAMKHAFPGGHTGQIRIDFESLDTHRRRLVVADSGIGLPGDLELDRAGTLGLDLVYLLTQQIDGTIHVRRDHGTTFVIEFSDAD